MLANLYFSPESVLPLVHVFDEFLCFLQLQQVANHLEASYV